MQRQESQYISEPRKIFNDGKQAHVFEAAVGENSILEPFCVFSPRAEKWESSQNQLNYKLTRQIFFSILFFAVQADERNSTESNLNFK